MTAKLPNGTCVVVADGTGAILYNKTGGNAVKLSKVGDLQPTDLDDDGPAGKRPPESTLQQTDEATFAKQLANNLYKRWNRERFDHVAIVADPETLGQMRPILHHEVSKRVILELGKTLTKSSIADTEKVLAAAIEK